MSEMSSQESQDSNQIVKQESSQDIQSQEDGEITDNQYLMGQQNFTKPLDQIEHDHNIIAEGFEEEYNPLQNVRDNQGYVKYLSQEEQKTLEKLQDNTIISMEKYKDIIQSSQKKSQDMFSEILDPQSNSEHSQSQVQSCMSFYQYKSQKQNLDQKMRESSSSYQSDKYCQQNLKKLQQSDNNDYFGEVSNSNNNIQQQLFQYNEDPQSQYDQNHPIQGQNFIEQEKLSNSEQISKSKGSTSSFFNDKQTGGDVYHLDSIQESEELYKNNHTNSSSYPHQYAQNSQQHQQNSQSITNSSEYQTQFELYKQQMKKESESRGVSPKNDSLNRNNFISFQNLEQNNQSDINEQNLTHEQMQQFFQQIQNSSAFKKVHFGTDSHLQDDQQKNSSRPNSKEGTEVNFFNKKLDLEFSNQKKEAYNHTSGFTFEKYYSQQNPSQQYTSFKFKSHPSSSPDSKLSPRNPQISPRNPQISPRDAQISPRSHYISLQKAQNSTSKLQTSPHNLLQQEDQIQYNTSQIQKSSPNKIQNKPQMLKNYNNNNRDQFLVNSMMKSPSVKEALQNLSNAIQSPVKRSPRQNKVKSSPHSNKLQELQIKTDKEQSPEQYNSAQEQQKSHNSSQNKENKNIQQKSNQVTPNKRQLLQKRNEGKGEEKNKIIKENKKVFDHINNKQRNRILPQQKTPKCFNYLNDNSNTSILKNTIIEWFENEKMQFQRQLDTFITNETIKKQQSALEIKTKNSLRIIQDNQKENNKDFHNTKQQIQSKENINSSNNTTKENKYIVSEREVTRIEDFLIEFELGLTQNNGIINQNLESKLQEFLNNEASIVYNRIINKKPSTSKYKIEEQIKKSKELFEGTQQLIGEKDQQLMPQQQINNLINSQSLSSQSQSCYKIIEIDRKIQLGLIYDQDIFNYTFHKKLLNDLSNSINIKTIQEQKLSTDSELKTQLFAALFAFLANFNTFIPVVNQRLQVSFMQFTCFMSKTWESSLNLLNKSGMIYNSLKKIPQQIEKHIYNPYLLSEFDEAFWEVENQACQMDKLLDDTEYTTIIKLIYATKTVMDILNENNLIEVDKKKLQINQKQTEQYLKKRDKKVKEGGQINAYLDKSVKEEQNAVSEKYGLNFQDWEKNLIQIQKDITTLKGKEKKTKWVEEREFKKNEKSKIKQRDLDDFERYKQQGIQQSDLNRSNYLQNIESKRERINHSTEMRMIEKKEKKVRNKSVISEEIEKTVRNQNLSQSQQNHIINKQISEQVFKKELEKKVVEQKQQEHIDLLDGMKEKRKQREQQIEELKKVEKEEKVWRRAQELLDKQSKLLYEREQLLKNKQYF